MDLHLNKIISNFHELNDLWASSNYALFKALAIRFLFALNLVFFFLNTEVYRAGSFQQSIFIPFIDLGN